MKASFFKIILSSLVFFSCSASKQSIQQSSQLNSNESEKALNHYLSGALYDFQDQYREALTEYRKALMFDTSSAEILKAIGRNYFRVQQYGYAIQYLTKSYQHQKKDRETLYYLAESYFNINDSDNAIVYYEKLNEIDPFNSSVQANLAYLYTRTGNMEKLIAFREKQVELYEYESEVVYKLIVLYLQSNAIEKASNLIQKLLEDAPNEPRNWSFYGNILELQKDTPGAITAYQKALVLNRDDEKTLNKLYFLHRDSDDWSGLAQTFAEVVEQDSANYRARLVLAEGYFNLGQYQQVRQLLNPLLAHESYREQAWEFLAVLYLQSQQYQECIALLQEALEVVPENKRLLFIYGSALQQTNRDREALQPLKKAYKLDPEDYNTIITLGLAFDNLKLYAPMDSLYEAAIKFFPDDALLLNNYSYSLSERGLQLRRALEMAQRAVEIEPDNGAYLDTIGWIHFQLGNYHIALQYIERAIAYREESPVVIEHLGDIHFKLGNPEKAKTYWRQALDKDPGNETLRDKLQEE